MEERLQKILARAGYGSRRSSETIISAGRVRVNGQVAGLGDKARVGEDEITVDGKLLKPEYEFVYIALYKPRKVISSVADEGDRYTVRDLIPIPGKLYPVGRLDFDSEGLVLMTNDGELTNRLTHPRYEHEKEYRVLVARHPDPEQLTSWRRGIILEDGYHTRPAQVFMEEKFGQGAWLKVILKEGRRRQIREMGTRTGLPVVRIIRQRIGNLHLGNLKPGEWRYLTPQEVTLLKQPARSQETQPARNKKPKERAGKKSYRG